MSDEYKSNINEILKSLKKKDVRAVQAAKRGMVRGMQFFEGKIIREQMSGRRVGDMGLNVETGTLRRSWVVDREDEGMGGDLVTTLATRTIYAAPHQFGYPAGGIPKRLTILEDFKKSGLRIISREVSRALIKEYKR